MSNDPILHLLGMSKKAGRLELGEEPVGAVCRAKQAKLLLLAQDAAPNTCRRAAHFGEAGNVLWLELPFTKAELGFALGRGSCAMLALTDPGFAASIVKKLADRSPERYGPAAQQLKQKADRALQRQREKRQHEKNLREGKRKPWVVPPDKSAAPKGKSKHTQSPSASKKAPASPSVVSHPKAASKQSRPHGGFRPGPGGRKLSGKVRRNP